MIAMNVMLAGLSGAELWMGTSSSRAPVMKTRYIGILGFIVDDFRNFPRIVQMLLFLESTLTTFAGFDPEGVISRQGKGPKTKTQSAGAPR